MNGFMKCVRDGGKVHTVKMGGKQVAICHINGESFKDEIHTRTKQKENLYTESLSAK